MTALLRRASEGDREAESVLVSENSGLIHTIARRYFGRGAEPDDLYQLACVGFIKAVRGFDPARGNEFSTYAVPKIAGEIRRFLRDDGAVKVSRAVKERAMRVRRVQSELEGRLGRSPSVSELAAACALTPEEVAVCEQADVSVDSLERELSGGGRLGDLVGDEGAVGVCEDRDGTGADGFVGEAGAVGGEAGQAHEELARGGVTGVDTDPQDAQVVEGGGVIS